jgi:hypothetical protein
MSQLKSRAEAEQATAAMAGAGRTAVEMAETVRRNVAAMVGAPDVADSGIEADLKAPVHVAWLRVMGEVEFVKKGRSPGLNYEFRGIDAVLNVVGPALRKHGVLVFPVKVSPEYTVVTSTKGSVMNYCRCVVRYTIMGPRGDVLMTHNDEGVEVPMISESLGEAFDTGDKASTKAQSVALRTFYINALAIPTNEPARDPEHGIQHELGAPSPRTAESYMEEILSDGTTINRLQQIKAELYGNRALGMAEVELIDGETISLAALVRRVGMARVGKAE